MRDAIKDSAFACDNEEALAAALAALQPPATDPPTITTPQRGREETE